MKKIIYLFTLLFLLSSCFNSSDNKTINEEKTIDSNTGVSVNNPLTEDEEITLQISANFEDFLKTLSSIEDVKQNLIKENDGNYLEEVPYIESYYTQNANTDFFILNSIKENNNTICDEISDDK
ncbi:MAG: lipoprotein [Candidatus Peribacteria bacterium]|jgi:hypothetical protein|nr:lipoprotein [Candidatus Peribacteria bacterium]